MEYPESLNGETSELTHLISKNNSSDRPKPVRDDSDDSSWDVVEDLPLRWATSYVTLAGVRLANTSVFSFTLWRDENSCARGATLLAVVTKGNIFLYEASKGQRAFRFVKASHIPPEGSLPLTVLITGVLRSNTASQRQFRHPKSRGDTTFNHRRFLNTQRPQAIREHQHPSQAQLIHRPTTARRPHLRPPTDSLHHLRQKSRLDPHRRLGRR